MLRADSSSCVGLGDIIALLSLPPPEIWVKGADEIPLTPPHTLQRETVYLLSGDPWDPREKGRAGQYPCLERR